MSAADTDLLDGTDSLAPGGSATVDIGVRVVPAGELVTRFVDEAEAALALAARYREPLKALTCYKASKHLFALTMITEIGDVKRFAHPRQLVSWVGMDMREYASGGKSHRFGITRQGNPYLRTALIEANQRGDRAARLGKDLKARRANSAPEYVAIAERCLRRLNKKGNRLLLDFLRLHRYGQPRDGRHHGKIGRCG